MCQLGTLLTKTVCPGTKQCAIGTRAQLNYTPGLWPGGPGQGPLAWGPWPGAPSLRARVVRTDRQNILCILQVPKKHARIICGLSDLERIVKIVRQYLIEFSSVNFVYESVIVDPSGFVIIKHRQVIDRLYIGVT